ncbi:unnamed protein product [Ectocarpus sp. 6 AP-2014]
MHRRCRTAVYLGLFSIAASLRAVLGGQHFEYDEDLGKLAVIYSSAAYDRVEEWVFANPACNEQTKGFVFVESFVGEHTDAFGFVGVDTVGERIVVAFKGTTDVQDWVTNLRTWIHYTHRCAPAGGPDTVAATTPHPGGEAVAPGQQAGAEISQSRSHQQHRRRPGGQPADLRGQEEAKASGGGEGWVDGRQAGSGAGQGRLWGHEPFHGAGIVGGEGDNNNNNNNNPGSSSGVGGRDPAAAAAAAGYASSSAKEAAPRERGDAPGGEGPGAGDDGEDDRLLIGNVHFGFCEFYQTLVAEGLAAKVLHLARKHPTYTIFVTGHSLGGAAAAVCAADLVERLGVASERVVLYTLGEPRAGDGIFADGINEQVGTAYRIVHDKDLVPHLSLCCHGWLGKCIGGEEACPYQHSTEIVYANDMSDGSPWIECDDTVGEDYACDPQQGWDLSIADHVSYFARTVGQYCNTPPEDLKPFPLAQEEEKAKWAPYEAAMRQEDDAYRPMERLRDA